MAVNTKIIKRRIKSITNTKKMTKAMEMISAVKMRKAVSQAAYTRAYAHAARSILGDLSERVNVAAHPLLERRIIKKTALVVITSNRGLAGGFNSKLIQLGHEYIQNEKKNGSETEIILLGKKGKKLFQQFKHKIVAEFEKVDIVSHINEVMPMARMLVKEYQTKNYDKIAIVYTDFKSALQQTARVIELLPIDPLIAFFNQDKEKKEHQTKKHSEFEFLFEPNPSSVLNQLLPRMIEMQIYQTVLESDASEHSARMLAMRNASDAAGDMIKDLVFTFNQARQAAITQEIAEIAGGAAALG